MKTKYITNKIKVAFFITILLALALSPINAKAATATATLTPSAQSVKEGGEFTVQFKLSNIDAAQGGITQITGTLVYDENAFEVIQDTSIEGKNDWKVNYDAFDKKITATHQQIIKNDGDIFQISFKAKTKGASGSGNQNQAAKIELKSISASNGIEKFQINDISTSVTIGNSGVTPQKPLTPTQPQVPTQPTQPTQPQTPKDNTSIPDAGVNDAPVLLILAMGSTAVITLLLSLKAKKS